jgi:hypothetical protein
MKLLADLQLADYFKEKSSRFLVMLLGDPRFLIKKNLFFEMIREIQ